MELSFSEILVIVLIAFVVFGPEDFIRKSRQFGEWFSRMKAHAQNFRVLAEEELMRKSGYQQIKDVQAEVVEARKALVNAQNLNDAKKVNDGPDTSRA